MAEQARLALGKRVWLKRVAGEVLEAYHRPPRDRPRELAAFIATRLDGVRRPPRVLREPIFHTEMAPSRWPVPRIDTVGDLAERLELDPGQLAWLADVKGLERRADREAAQLHLRARPAGDGAAARAGAPEAAAEGDPALDPARAAGLDSAARRRARVRQGSLGPHARRSAHRPPGGPRAGPRGLLRVRRRGARLRHLPHRGLSGGRRAHADRAVHERRACRGVRRRRVPALAPARDAAPAPGRAHLAGAGQPRRLPPGRAAHRPRRRDRRPLLALRRRSDVLRRPLPAPATRHDRDHRPRGGLPRERGQDAPDGPRLPPARHRDRRQRPPEHPARRVRPPEGDHPPGRLRPRPRSWAGSPGSST